MAKSKEQLEQEIGLKANEREAKIAKLKADNPNMEREQIELTIVNLELQLLGLELEKVTKDKPDK